MGKLILIFCLLIVNSVNAETPEWFTGVVVLKTKEIFNGEVSVNQSLDLLLFRNEGKVMVYAAHKIQLIRYFDPGANINRKFISIQQRKNHSTINELFEIVLSGDVSIIREPCAENLYSGDEAVGFKYFIKWGEEMVPLRKFKSRIYQQLVASSAVLATFINKNKLNPNFPSDIIKILQFYNIEKAGQVMVVNY